VLLHGGRRGGEERLNIGTQLQVFNDNPILKLKKKNCSTLYLLMLWMKRQTNKRHKCLVSLLIKFQPDATVCRYLFTAKSLYMFRVSQHPSSGVVKTVTATSGTGHNTGAATSLQRTNLIGTQSRSGSYVVTLHFSLLRQTENNTLRYLWCNVKNPTRCSK